MKLLGWTGSSKIVLKFGRLLSFVSSFLKGYRANWVKRIDPFLARSSKVIVMASKSTRVFVYLVLYIKT